MEFHIYDVDEKPEEGSIIQSNCGKEVKFNPIPAEWNDARVCQVCYTAHRAKHVSKLTFVVPEKTCSQCTMPIEADEHLCCGCEDLLYDLMDRTQKEKL